MTFVPVCICNLFAPGSSIYQYTKFKYLKSNHQHRYSEILGFSHLHVWYSPTYGWSLKYSFGDVINQTICSQWLVGFDTQNKNNKIPILFPVSQCDKPVTLSPLHFVLCVFSKFFRHFVSECCNKRSLQRSNGNAMLCPPRHFQI